MWVLGGRGRNFQEGGVHCDNDCLSVGVLSINICHLC